MGFDIVPCSIVRGGVGDVYCHSYAGRYAFTWAVKDVVPEPSWAVMQHTVRKHVWEQSSSSS